MSITKEQHKHSATINSSHIIIIEVDLHNLEVEVELEDHLISTLYLLPPQAQE